MPTVNDILGPNRLAVSPSDSIFEVTRKMRDFNLDVIAVSDHGIYRGIITEKEIISRIVALSRNPKREQAGSLMINDTPKVSLDTNIIDAAKIMARHRVSYVPVVQDGKFFGILTLDDLAKESLAAAAMVLTQRIYRKSQVNPRGALAAI